MKYIFLAIGLISLVAFGSWKIERALNWRLGYAPQVEERIQPLEDRITILEERIKELETNETLSSNSQRPSRP